MQVLQKIGDAVRTAGQAWHRFWFSAADPTPLCLMRWLVGGMLLYTHAVWGLQLDAFVGDEGFNSRSLVRFFQQDQIAPSFWWYVPANWATVVHVTCLVVLFCFWIGFATRLTSALSLLIAISYSYRAQLANFGLDQINAILCLYLAIGPSGAKLSVDAFLRKRWGRGWFPFKNRLAGGAERQVGESASVPANFALRLIQVHFCVIYAYAGLSKLQGPAWWSGEATWLAFANLEYQSLDMTWLAWYPWLTDLMTHTTILWEVSFAALVWVRPLRPVVLAVGFGLHFGIGAAMGMWTFGLIMMFGHVAFWPKEWVERLLALVRISIVRTASSQEAADGTASRSVVIPEPHPPIRPIPQLVYVDRAVNRRADTLRYFLQRGFRCVAADEAAAHQISGATRPDATVLLATEMQDEEIEAFHQTHRTRPAAEPLFLVMNQSQSDRLNGHVHTVGAHVITGRVSLGSLRREIQNVLDHADIPTTAASEESTEC
ncbi:MAG: hypothetical protein Fues2KO_22930 [Fuerstiella sp.]